MNDIEIDGVGKDKASWLYCGKFPLAEIAKDRRACRKGWRNFAIGEDKDFDMLSVVLLSDGNLGLQRESEDSIEGTGPYSCVKDMLSEDWYLEEEEK